MESLTIHKKAQKIIFNDYNKKMVFLLRFVFGLNLMNAIIFFWLFNSQEDTFKWIWLVFAVINVVALLFSLTKLSVDNELKFSEIDSVQNHSIMGVIFKLKNRKLRKVFIKKDSVEAKKLEKMFPNS